MLKKSIEKIIASQIELNQDTNLFFRGHPANAMIHTDFVHLLEQIDDLHEEDLSALIEDAAKKTVNTFYRQNQYITLSDTEMGKLQGLYFDTATMARKGLDVETVWTSHQTRLAQWISVLYPISQRVALQYQEQIGSVPCFEYSPDQIQKVYQLNVDTLTEPILDIGCGENALLVNHLNNRSMLARGFDRCAPRNELCCELGDWLDFNYGNRQWGSIFANMSYTNHYVYHQMQQTEFFRKYSDVYGKICGSLVEGGRFFYSPSLPEEEEALYSDEFHVTRITHIGISASIITRS